MSQYILRNISQYILRNISQYTLRYISQCILRYVSPYILRYVSPYILRYVSPYIFYYIFQVSFSSILRNSWYYTMKCSAICITYHDDHIKISIVLWERDTCIVAAALLSIVNISGKNCFHKDLFCVMVSHTKMLDYLTLCVLNFS